MLHGTLNNIGHLLRFRSNHEREVAMRRFRAFDGFAIAAAFAAQPALAQINEADRLARCQNNREALARAESQYQFLRQYADWSAEGIARARTAMTSLRRDLSTFTRELQEARQSDYPGIGMQVAARIGEQMRRTAMTFGVMCTPGDVACISGLPNALGREIDLAVAGRQPLQLADRQMQQHRTNLIALRCDEAAATQTIQSDSVGVPNFAGTWVDSDNRQFIISQSGADVTMSLFIFGRQESAQGSWSGGRLNLRWIAGNPPVPQQGSATVVTRGGVAVEIDFGGGFRYVRQ